MSQATPPVTARLRHAERVMGTVVSFDLAAAARADGSLDAAVKWLHWVDRVFSPFIGDSDVSLLARGETTVDACAPEVAEVIAACAAVGDLSGGYFTASPWGQFDPSGYVKGWAVERASSLLTAAGSTAHVVNGGGDVQCAGARSAAEGWRIGIASPLVAGGLALVVSGRDFAVATSGTAERGAHIVDPVAGKPANGLASLTVIGPSLALADAYATAAFAMGPVLARDWTQSIDGYEAFAILPDATTWQTSGFAKYIATDLPARVARAGTVAPQDREELVVGADQVCLVRRVETRRAPRRVLQHRGIDGAADREHPRLGCQVIHAQAVQAAAWGHGQPRHEQRLVARVERGQHVKAKRGADEPRRGQRGRRAHIVEAERFLHRVRELRVEDAQDDRCRPPAFAQLVPDGEASLQVGQVVACEHGDRGRGGQPHRPQHLRQRPVGDHNGDAERAGLPEMPVVLILLHDDDVAARRVQFLDDAQAHGPQPDHQDVAGQGGDLPPAE